MSGIELISAAIASNAGGHQAANLRVAEQWVAAWKAGRSSGAEDVVVGIPMEIMGMFFF